MSDPEESLESRPHSDRSGEDRENVESVDGVRGECMKREWERSEEYMSPKVCDKGDW